MRPWTGPHRSGIRWDGPSIGGRAPPSSAGCRSPRAVRSPAHARMEMAEAPLPHGNDTATIRMARWIMRHRVAVAALLALSTGFFFWPILNTVTTAFGLHLPGPVVRIDTNARDQWPQHPFINAQDKFAAKFGSATSVAIGLVVKEGTIFTPETLAKIDRIT